MARPKNKPKLLVVLGPTAVGKSDLAVQLAKTFNGEIISADSRQVYKGMDIGTGKITKKEMLGVPHYLLDVISPTAKQKFNISDFQKMAGMKIEEIVSRGKLPIICGGTGFYIQSIVDGIVLPEVSVNAQLREQLNKKTNEALVKILSKLDKNRLKNIDSNNKVRLIRAIEIAKTLGKVPKIKKQPNYETLQIGLDLPDTDLKSKINKRILVRIKKGMVKEAQKLHSKGLSYKRMREFGLEYKHLANVLENKCDKETFIQLLELDIWHYVKRQRSWFKRDQTISWYKPSELSKIKKTVAHFLKN